MKYIIAVLFVVLPTLTYAYGGGGSGTGGIPSVACYVDGENIGILAFTDCQRKKGDAHLKKVAVKVK